MSERESEYVRSRLAKAAFRMVWQPWIRPAVRKLYLRLREERDHVSAQRDRAIDLHEESFARWDSADRDLAAARARIAELESSLVRLCNAIECRDVASGLVGSDLIALAERLSHDDSGNDC